MSKNILGVVEQHIEKGILALAGLFLGAVLFMYVFSSPNKVDFEGKKYGPRELNEEIEKSANKLKTAIDSAPVPESKPEKYSEALKTAREGGIFKPLVVAKSDAAAPAP